MHRNVEDFELERLQRPAVLKRSLSCPARLRTDNRSSATPDSSSRRTSLEAGHGHDVGNISGNNDKSSNPTRRKVSKIQKVIKAISKLTGPPLGWLFGSLFAVVTLWLAFQSNRLAFKANEESKTQTKLAISDATHTFKQDCEARLSGINSTSPKYAQLDHDCAAVIESTLPPPYMNLNQTSTKVCRKGDEEDYISSIETLELFMRGNSLCHGHLRTEQSTGVLSFFTCSIINKTILSLR